LAMRYSKTSSRFSA